MQAHAWLNFAASADDPHPQAVQGRDELAAQLTKAQLADAQRLAREWTPGHAMGTARVKTAAAAPAPERTERPQRVAMADDGFPARPGPPFAPA